MSKWREYHLSEFFLFGNGKIRPSQHGLIPIYGGNGVLGFANQSNYDGETIIIGRVGAYCGSVFFEDRNIWVSDNALSAKPKSNYDTKFLYYLLNYINLNQYAEGSSHPLITQKLLNSINIFTTDDQIEQKAIAGVLSSLDDKIDLLQRQNKTLEAMAETLFRQWFIEEAEDDWEEVSLKSLCKVITKGTTPTTMQKKFVNSGVNFIKVNCIDENEYLLPEKFNYIDTETHLLLKRSQLEQGDILYSIAGTIGRIAQVSEELLPANINQALAIIRVNKKLISPYYIKYYLKSRATEYLLHSKIVHAVQPNLSLGEISNILVPLPNGKTYEMFCNIINRIEGRIENNKTTITKSKKTRDILLPKLMSGEVRVEF